MMTETEFVHPPTAITSGAILFAHPLRGALARTAGSVPRDGAVCAKNSIIDFFDEANHITGEGIY